VVLDDSRSGILDLFGTERVLELDFADGDAAAHALQGDTLSELNAENDGARVVVRFDTRIHSVSSVLSRIGSIADLHDVHLHDENIESIVTRFYEQRRAT
jgi:ABC-type uncharacterized transport system ATPase subunit